MVTHLGVLLAKESKVFETLAPVWTQVLCARASLMGRFKVFGRVVLTWVKVSILTRLGALLGGRSGAFETLVPAWTKVSCLKALLADRLEVCWRPVLVWVKVPVSTHSKTLLGNEPETFKNLVPAVIDLVVCDYFIQ